MRRPIAIIAPAAAAVLVACGGGSDSGPAVAVTNFAHSFANLDPKACSYLTPKAKSELMKSGSGLKVTSCESMITAVKGLVPLGGKAMKRQLDELKSVKASTVKTSGDRATVAVTLNGKRTTVPVVKVGGAWKVDSSDAAAVR